MRQKLNYIDLEYEMKRRGIHSNKKFAEISGISEQTLSRWKIEFKGGQSRPLNDITAFKIINALNSTPLSETGKNEIVKVDKIFTLYI